jgi:hypothetical protein
MHTQQRRRTITEIAGSSRSGTEMTDLGKFLVVLGGVIVIAGAVLLLAARFHLPLGRLPGDIVYRGKNTVFYFPIVTCILLSIILSLLLWLFRRGR